MDGKTPAIKVDGLYKAYKKVPVLQGISFTVERGAIFALLGANGAGKTTTINILTTLLKADRGNATIDGYDVDKQAATVRKRISLTGQFAAVDEVLTARENLMLISELRHEKAPAKTAELLLKQFELSDAADRRVITYSGGMRRRLDIAMSLIGTPSVIFLDEPTTGLDPQSRTMMWHTIKSLAENGTTVFLTTQYLEEADQLADTIAVLSHGTIAASGTPLELKKLLPQGRIVLRFDTQTELHAAGHVLRQYETVKHTDAYTLTVITDGSVVQIAKLFRTLESGHVAVAEFTQMMPTLDEAFLKIINTDMEK